VENTLLPINSKKRLRLKTVGLKSSTNGDFVVILPLNERAMLCRALIVGGRDLINQQVNDTPTGGAGSPGSNSASDGLKIHIKSHHGVYLDVQFFTDSADLLNLRLSAGIAIKKDPSVGLLKF
jgi:hypothetical protein